MTGKQANAKKYLIILGVAATCVCPASAAIADTAPPHGTLAAAIRAAKLPCAHVIEVQPTGEASWSVRCNAGTYSVTRDAEGNLKASR
jgi:hypothetical protein